MLAQSLPGGVDTLTPDGTIPKIPKHRAVKSSLDGSNTPCGTTTQDVAAVHLS